METILQKINCIKKLEKNLTFIEITIRSKLYRNKVMTNKRIKQNKKIKNKSNNKIKRSIVSEIEAI